MELYSDPLPEDSRVESDGVIWRNYRDYDPFATPAPDVFIAWRYAVSLGLCPAVMETLGFLNEAPKCTCILWLQDIVPADILPPAILDAARAASGLFFLAVPSVFHREVHLPAHMTPFARVMMNGIDTALVSEVAALVNETHRSQSTGLGRCRKREISTLIYARLVRHHNPLNS